MKHFIISLLITSFSFPLFAQKEDLSEDQKKEPPSFKLLRAEEDYTYLKDRENSGYKKDRFDGIKYVPLNPKGDFYLSLGGQIRPRFEHYTNRFWKTEEDQNFYSQRLALHSHIVFGKYFWLFGELYHGYTSHEEEFAEYDELAVFQAFAELKFPMKGKKKISIRIGRQEMGLGAARLVGIREGPNIRRSFDMGRIMYRKGKNSVQVFYGKEVLTGSNALDNRFTLFNNSAPNPSLWGIYTQFKIRGLQGMNEVYYLGFQADSTTLNDVTADELRHTVGLRRFGKIGERWKYNSEIIYQLGKHGEGDIGAFNIETDWKYELIGTRWKVTPGLKLDYTSGDREAGDGNMNTFNPMFVNPAYYSLAATITPVNMISVHPSISLEPIEKFEIYLEWAAFWRASKEDALYRPTRFINYPAQGSEEAYIGNQFGLEVEYEVNRHVALELDISYFIVGNFLKGTGTGEAENIIHVAPTLNFKF